MIVLDTNVLSALMRTQPEPVVVDWLDRQSADSIWITAITQGRVPRQRNARDEGIPNVHRTPGLLPLGRQRRGMSGGGAGEREHPVFQFRFQQTCEGDFQNLSLPTIRQQGQPQAGFELATRNRRHFEGLTVPVVNPWEDPEPKAPGDLA